MHDCQMMRHWHYGLIWKVSDGSETWQLIAQSICLMFPSSKAAKGPISNHAIMPEPQSKASFGIVPKASLGNIDDSYIFTEGLAKRTGTLNHF